MNVQWFPGHMMKTQRMMTENIKLIDLVIEIVDCRLPLSSRNPVIDTIVGDKPRLLLLNKSDIADSAVTKLWEDYFKSKGIPTMVICCVGGKGLNAIFTKCKQILADKIERQKQRGLVNRSVKLMIVGVPNVGKSSLINKLSGKKSAITGDRPGVTRGKQWIRLSNGFELLDTPGILWPKFDDKEVGLKLAYTGAVKDEIMDIEELACNLIVFLKENYPLSLETRYKITENDGISNKNGYELLQLLGKKRGFIISGGEIDTERAANIFLDEFRAAKLGNISLEKPSDFE